MLCYVYAAYRRSLLRVRSMARCELTFSSCSCAILAVAGRGMLVCIHNRGLAIYCSRALVR